MIASLGSFMHYPLISSMSLYCVGFHCTLFDLLSQMAPSSLMTHQQWTLISLVDHWLLFLSNLLSYWYITANQATVISFPISYHCSHCCLVVVPSTHMYADSQLCSTGEVRHFVSYSPRGWGIFLCYPFGM